MSRPVPKCPTAQLGLWASLTVLISRRITLILMPVFYWIAVLDLKAIKWEAGKH
jgi:hypothetical protein